MLSLLPATWRHPTETSLRLGRFERTRRARQKDRRARAAAAGASAASGSAHLGLASGLVRAAAAPDAPSDSSPRGGSSGGAAGAAGAAGVGVDGAHANVLVARRRHGIEVLHLYTGRTLTQLPLPEASLHGASAQAHADINGDGIVDHIAAVNTKGTGRHSCHAIATSGVPAREALWNTTVCAGAPAVGRPGAHKPRDMATPLPIRMRRAGGGRPLFDVIFLCSDGKMSSAGPHLVYPHTVQSPHRLPSTWCTADPMHRV